MAAVERIRIFLLALIVATATPLRAGWGDPRGFFEAEKVSETALAPGLTWIAAAGTHQGRPVESQMLVMDPAAGALELRALTGGKVLVPASGQYVRRTTVSELAGRPGCLGAINVAFFDIGATQATQGLVIQQGKMLREPQAGRPSLLVAADGRLHLGDVTWTGKVRLGKRSRPLEGVNRPQLGAGEVVVYHGPWDASPGKQAAFARDAGGLELLVGPVTFTPPAKAGEPAVLAGRLLSIHRDGARVPIGADRMLLRAGASAAAFFRHARPGDAVAVEWTLAGLPAGLEFHRVHQAVSAQPELVRDGLPLAGSGSFWTTRHPRSAVAVDRDGRRALLLVVDGRSARSAGMSLDSLAAYLQHLGAHAAMNFDGGGSSAIAARVRGKVEVLNMPSDGRERPMPTGLGIFTAPPP
jgi:hypothetical protein